MTFRVVQVISQANQDLIREHLDTVVQSLLQPDVSNYAKGRMRVWLQHEAPLSAAQPWRPGLRDDRLWNYLVRAFSTHGFTPEVGLASKGGAITRHRDAAYADYRGFGLNLGVTKFHYELCYPQFRWSKDAPSEAEPEVHQLTGGEIFEFNVKNPHWVSDVAPDRWGINCWRISAKERGRFPG